MKKFKSDELINGLQADVRQMIAAAEMMKGMDKIKLSYPRTDNQWTAIQALEHLNMYNRYYLPAIDRAMSLHPGGSRNAWFNPGFFGNYFTKSMKPTNVFEVKNKMKAMKGYYPPGALSSEKVIGEFIEHQHKLLQLMDIARDRDLSAIRIPITVSKYIKLKLGDTFRFLIAHEQRHMIQARNAIHSIGITTDKFPVILQAVQR